MTDWHRRKTLPLSPEQRRLLAKIVGAGSYRPISREWTTAYSLERFGLATKLDFEMRPTERGKVEHQKHAP